MNRYHNFINQNHIQLLGNHFDIYFNNKFTDCILYSQDGANFKIHKQIFNQTDFLREILSSDKGHCCENLVVFCPCTGEELGHLVNFLYNGEICYKNENDLWKIQENLVKVFGFRENFILRRKQNPFESTKESTKNQSQSENGMKVEAKEKETLFQNLEEHEENKTDFVTSQEQQKSSNYEVEKSQTVKDFQCNNCEASFNEKESWKRHMNWVHLTCSECEITFEQRHQLGNHMNSVHLHVKPYKPICAGGSKKFILDCENDNKPYESFQHDKPNELSETYEPLNFEPYEPEEPLDSEKTSELNEPNDLIETYESFEADENYDPDDPSEFDDSPYEPYEPYEKYEPYEPY